jgi:hypothetical protein
MANAKISNDTVFVPETDISNIDGLAGFAGTGNVKITGTALVASLETNLNLSNFASGTLAVGRGGTGATTFTANGILIGNTASAISATAELTDGQLLIGSTGNAPSPAALTAGTGITVTNGSGSISITNSAPDQTVVLNAGTGITTSGTYPNFTITNSSPNQATPAASDGSPSTGQLQYNNGSNGFAAADTLVYSSRVLSVGKVGDSARSHLKIFGGDDGAGNDQDAYLTLYCSAGTHGVTIEGPDHTGGSNYTLKLPKVITTQSVYSSGGRILESDASGALQWIATPTDTSIYDANGSLTSARTVTMGSNDLTFASTTAGQEVKFEQNVEVAGQGYTDLYTGATIDGIDWDNGNVQEVILPNSATDFDPSNAEPGATYILILKQPASGAAGTINWGGGSGTVRWPGGTPPILSTANNAVDIVTLVCVNSNSTYYATSVLNLS